MILQNCPFNLVFTIARNKKTDFSEKNTNMKINEEDIREFLYEDNQKIRL